MELETAVRMGISTLTIVVNNEGTGGGLMGMDSPSGPPPDMAKLTGDWSLVAKGLGAYSERVEDPVEVGPALQRAITATKNGQAALVEIMIKPMATPNTPDDWSI
jgi:acetolactate synthase-1/2/3 large subunit